MASADADSANDFEPVSEWLAEDGACCVCGSEAVELYDDREDCPYCGSVQCGMMIQAAMDYHEGAGDR